MRTFSRHFDDSVLPNPLDYLEASPLFSMPSPSPEYYFDQRTDNPMICDTNVNLGYKKNVLDVIGRNVDDDVSLGYFRGYDPCIDFILYA